MVLERREGGVRLALNQDAPENSGRPAVDVLFRSVAKTFGANVLAVVLTGMGSDGVRGCELIREQGGQVLGTGRSELGGVGYAGTSGGSRVCIRRFPAGRAGS
jgi:two-component system chemotaxis response regulator CheB